MIRQSRTGLRKRSCATGAAAGRRTILQLHYKICPTHPIDVVTEQDGKRDDFVRMRVEPWAVAVLVPIYAIRSYIKREVKPRSLLAYNLIKFGSLALLVYLVYMLFERLSQLS